MTEKLHKTLGLAHKHVNKRVSGIGELSTESRKRSVVTVQSSTSNFSAMLEVFVMKQITSCQPATKINTDDWNISKNIALTDPKFNTPAAIDIIIG